MNPLIIIQARLNSTRLPGKVLMPIKGKPMLEYLMQRVGETDLETMVATTDEGIHDEFGGYLYEGDENDVAGRFQMVLDTMENPPVFVRLCGDSPLMDPALISAAIALYEPPYFEIRSPVGSVEVCDTAEFFKGLPDMTAHEREHVTLRLRPAGRSLGFGHGRRLVVDEQADFDLVTKVVEKMGDAPHTQFGWRECCALRDQCV